MYLKGSICICAFSAEIAEKRKYVLLSKLLFDSQIFQMALDLARFFNQVLQRLPAIICVKDFS